jgi:hypothetical protein
MWCRREEMTKVVVCAWLKVDDVRKNDENTRPGAGGG